MRGNSILAKDVVLGKRFVCPNCGSVSIQKRGLYHTNAYTYQRFCCNNCGAWSRGRKTLIPAEKAETILVGIR